MKYIQDPRAAEENAAKVMKKLGFTDARCTPVGPDGGIDVVARDAVAQVKWQGGQVGRGEIQGLYGARGRDYERAMLFFSASGYSRQAIDCADDLDVALFTYGPDGEVVAQNSSAVTLVRRSDAPAEVDKTEHVRPVSPLNAPDEPEWRVLGLNSEAEFKNLHARTGEVAGKVGHITREPDGSILLTSERGTFRWDSGRNKWVMLSNETWNFAPPERMPFTYRYRKSSPTRQQIKFWQNVQLALIACLCLALMVGSVVVGWYWLSIISAACAAFLFLVMLRD